MTARELLRLCGFAFLLLCTVGQHVYATVVAEASVRQDDAYNADSHTSPAASSASLSVLLGSAWADASVPAGTLKAYAHTTTSDVLGVHGADTNAYASTDDYYTLIGLAPGTSVWLTGYVDIAGRLVTAPAGSFLAYSGYTANFGGSSGHTLSSLPGGEMAIHDQLMQQFYVTAGAPFRVAAALAAFATGWNHYDALADFSATAILSFDLSGLPQGASISSTEGFLQSNAAPVPEPANVFLLFLGLVVLMGYASRRRS